MEIPIAYQNTRPLQLILYFVCLIYFILNVKRYQQQASVPSRFQIVTDENK